MDNIKTIKNLQNKSQKKQKRKINKNIYLQELQKIAKENAIKYSYDYDKKQYKKGGTKNIEVTTYKNGFVVNDENAIRNYRSPSNVDFMSSINQHQVPQELKDKYPDKEILINVQNKRHIFHQIKKSSTQDDKQFKGKGIALGNPVKRQPLIYQRGKLQLKEGENVYKLQIKFSNEKVQIIKINKSTKFPEIKNEIQKILKSRNFKIFKIYPYKNITNSNKTVNQLDLIDSTVRVELIQFYQLILSNEGE